MLIDHQVETPAEENILPQQSIRRLANGSIDYTFYDKRARTHRGVAFRTAIRLVTAFVVRIFNLMAPTRPEYQTVPQQGIELTAAHPRGRRGYKRIETTTVSRKSYSEAA